MTGQFHLFGNAVRKRFDALAQNSLFVVDSDRDGIWDRYLAAFPPGSNPIFRQRTEHDCSCCRHFIRSVGNVVAIADNEIATIWDVRDLPYPFQRVADAMAAYIRGLSICDVFLTPFATLARNPS